MEKQTKKKRLTKVERSKIKIGLLVYWFIGLLVYWFIGLLVYCLLVAGTGCASSNNILAR
jgi:hypothetical protein